MTRPAHILIVDDHREIRDALKKYLEKNGLHAQAVENAQAMDRALQKDHYDLVILDVMMPGEDGLSVCRRLRVESDVAILMLTPWAKKRIESSALNWVPMTTWPNRSDRKSVV